MAHSQNGQTRRTVRTAFQASISVATVLIVAVPVALSAVQKALSPEQYAVLAGPGVKVARRALALTLTMLAGAGCAHPAPALPGSAPEVTLTFGGDVHFQARVARLLDSPGTVFGPAAARLSDGDLSFVNLETPITSRGTAEPKTYLFRAGPQAARALTAAGVDAVTLANNHSMDYGRVGLADTFAAANAAHLGYFGAGRDVQQAYAPWRATVRGVRIAVFGFSQVDDLAESWAAGPKRSGVAMAFDTRRAAAAVEAARPDSDLIVVMPHWGEEGNRCPTQRQQDFAELMAHAGADVIVGAHAHVLQGGGYLGGTYVAYGLGNLLWYSGGLFPPYSSQSGILTLTLRGRKVVGTRFTPTVVSGTGRPRVLSGRDADIARLDYLRLRVCAGLSSTGS